MLNLRRLIGLKPKRRDHDIFTGADDNDIAEIIAALAEDYDCLDEQEPLTGKTALAIAAADGNFLALDFLLTTHGADPWIKDHHGRLPLDYARAIGHRECRQRLLENMFPDLDTPPSATRLRRRGPS
ncbi:MAG: ankyrin repeat domain-containing protein [Pseudomonadota bacterium]